ncbi:response regulator [Geomonas sp. Red32]|uniref:hybrid sensor histidine kinase/response regulator n=1 Tax=Geomonas sp. Red32 TaxID=2912856 RepID=UPI00202CAD1F|nr:response regulator [Geomonas sp. Red32]MCM0080568.1 response regulator [Geomonas sp. Red32]
MLCDTPNAPLILLVESDLQAATSIRQAFDTAPGQYRMDSVAALPDAYEYLERRSPDLVIADYLLADGDNNTLVAKTFGICPVILMAAQGNERTAVMAIKAGAQDYLAKSPEAYASLPEISQAALREWQILEERRKIQEKVSRGKREWEQTFDAVSDLILIVDTNHTISRANRAMAERLGLSPADLPGRKCYEVFHHSSTPSHCCPFDRLIGEGGEQREEIEEPTLKGFFELTASPLYDEQGELVACVHVAREITERKRIEEEHLALEQQLQQAQKLESLGVLAGGIAHDFNNILMIILGHCYLAEDDEADAQRTHLKQIETAASRAADLCRQMLAYAGKSPLVQSRVELRALVQEMVEMLRSAMKKNVTFDFEESGVLPEIMGDKAKIQQIVMNLIVNAAEAIGEQTGVVTVGLSSRELDSGQEADFLGNPIPAGSYVCLKVADTGCGMDEETRKRIFEPFFTTKFTGRGLGMSAIIGIVKSHAGALQVGSTPGVGTIFKVYFPISTGAGDAKASPLRTADSREGDPGGQGTVLLVDDEPELRAIGAILLKAMGFSVLTAEDGGGAVHLYEERKADIDLVFMDLTMPKMDGIKAYQEMRRLSKTVPIVICSGYDNNEISLAIKQDLLAGFVSKPYQTEQVRQLLMRLLQKEL